MISPTNYKAQCKFKPRDDLYAEYSTIFTQIESNRARIKRLKINGFLDWAEINKLESDNKELGKLSGILTAEIESRPLKFRS